MRTLQIFENAVEAEILRTRLDAAGILAVVNGGEVATMLSHIGTAAVSVRVEVAPEDFDRAAELLREDETDRAHKTAWKCQRCDERNEPLFDLCWSCGKSRDVSSVAETLDEIGLAPESESGSIVAARQANARASITNPYAPPLIDRSRSEVATTNIATEPDPRVVDAVTLIFRGAVIGMVILPPLLTLYVLFRLVFEIPRSAYQTPRLKRRLIASWCLCLLSFGSAALFWGLLYRS